MQNGLNPPVLNIYFENFKKNTIYYGGGYHAIEKNTNKTVEGRLTVRPFVQSLPRLQLTYLGAFGKRNKENIPKWRLNSFFLSWEHSTFVLTEMYFLGKGNTYGSAIDATGLALSQDGYSIFGEYKFINSNLRLIGRYDFFNSENIPKEIVRERYIIGCAYHFLHG